MRLSTLYPTLSRAEQEALAQAVDSEVGYLWQLSTRWRGKSASLAFMKKLADADSRLTFAEMAEEFAERVDPSPSAGNDHATAEAKVG